ncbi:glycosyltransferase family 2 protein [Paenibacillus sp. NRS-1760]|uniref:glycosyltransferase family 2 protein n=1 Tax=Paenibacillus sp. NRS-1760 TaxID=3233902 RepID=UPI003D29F077
MEKISVILPSYNVEKYIGKCLESLLKQSYNNLEIIIVNDGSTDGTLEIAKEFLNIDKRLIVTNQDNQGVSIARNNAINLSTGEYIIFVDPDDYVHEDFVKSLYESLIQNKSDLAICGHTKVYDDLTEVKSKTSRSLFTDDVIFEEYFIGESTLTVLMCDKIFKSNIIKENNIHCPIEVTSGQDQVFILEYLLYCNSVSTVDNNYYYYYQRIGSKSKRYEYYIFERTIIKLEYLKDLLKKHKLYDKFEGYFKIRLYMNLFSQGLLLYRYDSKENFKSKFRKLLDDSVKYINKSRLSILLDIVLFSKLNIKEKVSCFVIYFFPSVFVKFLYKTYLNMQLKG